jgi:cytochrome c
MFDTMTATKTVGALCGAALIFFLVKWGAESLYSMEPAKVGGEEPAQAYSVAVSGGEAAGGSTAEAGPDFDTVYASADAKKGETIFNKCKACHKVDGSDSVGPHLNGIVGRAVGSVAGFAYSDGVKNHGGTWDPKSLDTWIENPKKDIPGTKMTFAGLPKVEDRANLIAYLATIK